MNLVSRYLERTEFKDYEDYHANLRYKPVEKFNFAYDVVDEYAKLEPHKRALVWCDDYGNERIFNFADLKFWSDKISQFLHA